MSNDNTLTNDKNIDLTRELTLPVDPAAKKTDIQNPELWAFPMDYPMSIIGHEGKHDSLLDEVKLILGTQFPEFDLLSIQVKKSSTGRFSSLRVNLYLTHAEQVNILYAALDNAETVRTVI